MTVQHVRWPTFEAWLSHWYRISEGSGDVSELTEVELPSIYDFAVSTAEDVLGMDARVDYDRPERVARIVARWLFPAWISQQSTRIAGSALVAALLDEATEPHDTKPLRWQWMLTLQIAASLHQGLEYEGEDLAAKYIDREWAEKASKQLGRPYDYAWDLIHAWLDSADGQASSRPTSTSFESWLMRHPSTVSNT